MQVILREDIEKVGLRGEVVDVAAGFARNYLLPRRLAEPAAPGRVAELEKPRGLRALWAWIKRLFTGGKSKSTPAEAPAVP